MKWDAELAEMCADAYLPGATVAIGDDLAVNIIERDGAKIVAFRGTANAHGWLRDLNALPKSHDLLGYCHHGFLDGACALLQKINIADDVHVIMTGHSLGGGLAALYGALRIAGNQRVGQLVTFGAPKPGYERLRQVWRAVMPSDIRQYHNGNDPVPEVPLTLTVFPYLHVAESLTQIGTPDHAEPWTCHGIRRYAAIVAELPEKPNGP